MLFLLFLLAFADPSEARVLLQRGLAALQHGQLIQAREALEQSSRLAPTDAYIWSSLAQTYFRLKNPAKAEAAAISAEKFGGANPVVAHALAIFYTEAGQFAHAAQLEEKYAASPQSDPAAVERAAGLYLNAADAPHALPLAQKAFEIRPSPSTDDLLGRALLLAGRPGEAEKHLGAAWDSAKTDPRFAFDYADLLLQKQDFVRAAEVADAALAAHPDDPQLVLTIGVARYGERRFEDAVAAFLRVIQIDPRIEQPYRFLGRMLDQAGTHLPQITKAFERWAARNPKDGAAQLLLAQVRLANNPKDATAEGLLRRSLALDARNWEAHYELGVLLTDKHDYQGAASELMRSAELDPKQPMPHYHLARVYDRLGQPEQAKAEREIHQRLTK